MTSLLAVERLSVGEGEGEGDGEGVGEGVREISLIIIESVDATRFVRELSE